MGRPVNPPGWLAVECTYLKRVPGREDCLECQRPRCVHDGEPVDGRRKDTKGKPQAHPWGLGNCQGKVDSWGE